MSATETEGLPSGLESDRVTYLEARDKVQGPGRPPAQPLIVPYSLLVMEEEACVRRGGFKLAVSFCKLHPGSGNILLVV